MFFRKKLLFWIEQVLMVRCIQNEFVGLSWFRAISLLEVYLKPSSPGLNYQFFSSLQQSFVLPKYILKD